MLAVATRSQSIVALLNELQFFCQYVIVLVEMVKIMDKKSGETHSFVLIRDSLPLQGIFLQLGGPT